jgi:hypothetical protein
LLRSEAQYPALQQAHMQLLHYCLALRAQQVQQLQ